jgi:hypothetical protein
MFAYSTSPNAIRSEQFKHVGMALFLIFLDQFANLWIGLIAFSPQQPAPSEWNNAVFDCSNRAGDDHRRRSALTHRCNEYGRTKHCAPFDNFECRGESMIFDPRRNKSTVSFTLRMIRRRWRIDALVGRESGDDFTTVATFALFGLALSLLAMGKGGLIYPEYMTNLLLLF